MCGALRQFACMCIREAFCDCGEKECLFVVMFAVWVSGFYITSVALWMACLID